MNERVGRKIHKTLMIRPRNASLGPDQENSSFFMADFRSGYRFSVWHRSACTWPVWVGRQSGADHFSKKQETHESRGGVRRGWNSSVNAGEFLFFPQTIRQFASHFFPALAATVAFWRPTAHDEATSMSWEPHREQ
jgi:hypothetical protein